MKFIISIIIFFLGISFTYSQTWSAVGPGFGVAGRTAWSMKEFQGFLYVGGNFQGIGNIDAYLMAKWDGYNWYDLPKTPNSASSSLEVYKDELFVGGHFSNIGPSWIYDPEHVPNTRLIACWDGVNWYSVGGGFTSGSTVQSMQQIGDLLYVGGRIGEVGNLAVRRIARWDSLSWTDVGGGVSGDFSQISAMAVFNNDLIVGGYFTKAGNKPAFSIARWDGLQWHDLDTGLLGGVDALTVDTINNILYVGGMDIYHVGGNSGFYAHRLIKWDGFKWDSIQDAENAIYINGVYSLAIYNNILFIGMVDYLGASFDTTLCKWDGIQWTKIYGSWSTLKPLYVYNKELYVGGHSFVTSSGDTTYGIARYHEPPDTVNCTFIQPLIHAMPYGTKEVGDTIKTTPPYDIQFYTNNKYASTWAWDFGDGNTANIREPAHTYAAPGTYNVTLEVIHPHNLSSQVCTLNVSKTITIVDVTDIKEPETKQTEYLGQNIPNPFSNTTVIPYYVPHGSKGFLQIHSTKGELIDEYALQHGHNRLEISMGSYTAGVYLYSILIDNERKQTKRMVVGDE